MMANRSGIEKHNRILLETLHQQAQGPFTAAQAAGFLGVEAVRATRLLQQLAEQGWLARVRRGLYTLVPLGATAPKEWREDPWIVASVTFAPCYISGWSACEHWSLTEQLFRDIIVMSGALLRERNVTLQGTLFRVKHVPTQKHFGVRSVWRGTSRIHVADPARAIVDILDEPAIGGGIKHVAEVIASYFASEHRADSTLLDYIKRLGNRTVYKRLGYLIEALDIEAADVVASCERLQSTGISSLDPQGPPKGHIIKRWNLKVNSEVAKASPS